MKVKLTNNTIEKAKPQTKPYELRDTRLIGLIVRVQPTGKKTYYCEYQRGSRLKLGVFPSLSVKDAHTKALKVFSEFHSGIDLRKPRSNTVKVQKFEEFLELYYFPWVDANHKNPKDTKNRLTAECRHFLKYRFSEITPHEVDKWRLSKIAKGNSPHTANKCFAYLRAALSKADEWEVYSPNPIAKMKKIKTNKSLRIRYLSKDEEARLRQGLRTREDKLEHTNLNFHPFKDHLLPMVLISINTGMRRGEVFSLKWQNVSFELKQLSIIAENAKSRKVRHIPLNAEALETLQKLHHNELQVDMFVFRRRDNEPFTDIKHAWAKLLGDADIQNFRWHDMRHHFASKLAMAGVDLNTVRELLGHSSYEMTLRYAHLSAGHKANAVQKLCPQS